MEYFLVLYMARGIAVLPEKYNLDECVKAGTNVNWLSYKCVPAPTKSNNQHHLNIDTYRSKLCTADMKHCE